MQNMFLFKIFWNESHSSHRTSLWDFCSCNKTTLATINYNAHGTTIKCLDLNGNLVKIYQKVADAAREVGCHPASITGCIKGREKTCKGYKWAYL